MPRFCTVDAFQDTRCRALDPSENGTSSSRFEIPMGIARVSDSTTIDVSKFRSHTSANHQGNYHLRLWTRDVRDHDF